MNRQLEAKSSRQSAPRRISGALLTTRDLAHHSGLSPARVRRCVHAGFLRPTRGHRRRFEFTLRDLVILRATDQLLAARIGPRRISKILQQLQSRMTKARDASSLRLSISDGEVIVHEGRVRWQAESGQMLLGLGAGRGRGQVRAIDPARENHAREQSAVVWLRRAVAAEGPKPDQAIAFYREALALDPHCAAAQVNLGRLLQRAGKRDLAEQHYNRALKTGSAQAAVLATAALNLGVLAEEGGELRRAVESYRRALAIDPSFADAHRLLARLLGNTGKREEARAHLSAYRRLVKR